jgi:hypothetical protein
MYRFFKNLVEEITCQYWIKLTGLAFEKKLLSLDIKGSFRGMDKEYFTGNLLR